VITLHIHVLHELFTIVEIRLIQRFSRSYWRLW